MKSRKRVVFFVEIILFCVAYIVFLLTIRRYIPDAGVIIESIRTIYGEYGYELIFLGALLEGTFIVGFYVPGSIIILLGAVLARSGVVSFPLVILFGTLGLWLGYVINYALGRFGLYRILAGFGFDSAIAQAKQKLIRYQDAALFWGYVMPSTGSFLSTAAGILKVPFKQFLTRSLFIQTFWSFVLGGMSYIFGGMFIEGFLHYFGFFAFVGFGLYLLNELHKNKKHKRKK